MQMIQNLNLMLWFIIDFADAVVVALSAFSCIMVGEFERMRDAIARVLVFWTEDMELYPYILALYVILY